MTDFTDHLFNFLRSGDFLSILIGMTLAFAVGQMAARIARERLPRAYSIAVVGFPRSGKTTLITAMFGEMFAHRVLGYKVTPRGEQTIERVNQDLEKLELGRALGPTTDQDLFAYRADVVRGSALFAKRYKVEIGDFPGEDSKVFAEKFHDWFHHTPYFKWAMEADAFIFIVDLAYTLDPSSAHEYAARVTRAVRAAWQRLVENHLEGKASLQAKSVVLAFTKADLFGAETGRNAGSDLANAVMRLGFGDEVPVRVEVDERVFREGKQRTDSLFAELIGYLGAQSSRFTTVYVSCFGYLRGERIGVEAVLKAVLP